MQSITTQVRRTRYNLVNSLKKFIQKTSRKYGIEVRRVVRQDKSVDVLADNADGVPYKENPEAGPINWAVKEERVAAGGTFENTQVAGVNDAIVSLVGSAKRIVELGSGTGRFAIGVAADPSRSIVCSELDEYAINWARTHRSRPNIEYVQRLVTPEDGPFDLAVAVEVIEHIGDYRSFLETCAALAPRAILTTPNKGRYPQAAYASPPLFEQHVREWTAGEFYWVLRTFYRSVALYALTEDKVPAIVPIRVTDTLTPLIAVCEQPY